MSELALSHSNIDVACGVSFMSALAISHSNTDVTCGVLSMTALAISHSNTDVTCGVLSMSVLAISHEAPYRGVRLGRVANVCRLHRTQRDLSILDEPHSKCVVYVLEHALENHFASATVLVAFGL